MNDKVPSPIQAAPTAEPDFSQFPKEEWDALSPEDKDLWANHFYKMSGAGSLRGGVFVVDRNKKVLRAVAANEMPKYLRFEALTQKFGVPPGYPPPGMSIDDSYDWSEIPESEGGKIEPIKREFEDITSVRKFKDLFKIALPGESHNHIGSIKLPDGSVRIARFFAKGRETGGPEVLAEKGTIPDGGTYVLRGRRDKTTPDKKFIWRSTTSTWELLSPDQSEQAADVSRARRKEVLPAPAAAVATDASRLTEEFKSHYPLRIENSNFYSNAVAVSGLIEVVELQIPGDAASGNQSWISKGTYEQGDELELSGGSKYRLDLTTGGPAWVPVLADPRPTPTEPPPAPITGAPTLEADPTPVLPVLPVADPPVLVPRIEPVPTPDIKDMVAHEVAALMQAQNAQIAELTRKNDELLARLSRDTGVHGWLVRGEGAIDDRERALELAIAQRGRKAWESEEHKLTKAKELYAAMMERRKNDRPGVDAGNAVVWLSSGLTAAALKGTGVLAAAGLAWAGVPLMAASGAGAAVATGIMGWRKAKREGSRSPGLKAVLWSMFGGLGAAVGMWGVETQLPGMMAPDGILGRAISAIKNTFR